MPDREQGAVRIADAVATALSAQRPVVALETSIVSHGLPRPHNLDVGRAMAASVAAEGAVPAFTAVLDGVLRVGLDDAALMRLANAPGVAKASARDLARLAAQGASGATTVAGTLALATAVGIDVVATGGIGGVHRGAGESFDLSADLDALARTRAVVVCAGAKSLLDIAATMEWLESRSVPVVGWRTNRLPAFFAADAGLEVPRVDELRELVQLVRTHRALGGAGIVVAQPPPEPLEADALAAWTAAAHETAVARGIAGAAVTPFVLAEMARLSDGATVVANRALVLANAALAARLVSHPQWPSLEPRAGAAYT